MNEVLAAVGLDGAAIELVISGRRSLTWIVRAASDGCRRVVRVHRGTGENRVAREHDTLTSLRAAAPASFALAVPEPLRRERVGSGEAVVLSFLEGIPLAPARGVPALRAQLEAVRIWLAELWSIPAPESLGERYGCAATLAALDGDVAAIGPRLVASWSEVLAAAHALDAAPATWCHFDLGPSNVLVNGSGIRVLDWEYARRGQPLYDWFRFVVQMGLAWRARPPDLSRPLDDDQRILGPVRRLFFDVGDLAEAVADETLAATALAGLDLSGADGWLRASLLQYLGPQIPWRDRRALIELVLGEPSAVGRRL